MSVAASTLGRLWGPPGRAAAGTRALLTRAADVHARLLLNAAACPQLRDSLSPILDFLDGRAPAVEKRRLLCHPLFIEGLHDFAPLVPQVGHWHETVTACHETKDDVSGLCGVSLGHVGLALALRKDNWQRGDWTCRTDVSGQLGFPFTDWSLKLRSADGKGLGQRVLHLRIEDELALWSRAGDRAPFLVMPRDDLIRLIVENGFPSHQGRLGFPNPRVRPVLQRATVMGNSGVRFDPVGCGREQTHAGLTGGLTFAVLTALRRNSPCVYREFCRFIHTVRGCELPTSERGTVGSFSDPTLPGVMGINITYTPDDEPCLDPFCFTWFGHEMGHTKNYLVDTVLFGEGETLVSNAVDQTGPILRYGRSFSVRTLFQIPYVHLYEWVLLMDFYEGGFRGLPWDVPGTVEAVGADLAAEIEEAFELIDDKARVTALGTAAVRYFRELAAENKCRWHSLGFAAP